MRTLSIFLNIILVLGVTTVVFSLRGPVNGRMYNRDGHEKAVGFIRDVNGNETDVAVAYGGADSDGPVESLSYAETGKGDENGRIFHYSTAESGVTCNQPGYKGEFYVSATLHHSWAPAV